MLRAALLASRARRVHAAARSSRRRPPPGRSSRRLTSSPSARARARRTRTACTRARDSWDAQKDQLLGNGGAAHRRRQDEVRCRDRPHEGVRRWRRADVLGSLMRIERDVPLAPRTTLGIGGPAREFVRVTTVDELREAARREPTSRCSSSAAARTSSSATPGWRRPRRPDRDPGVRSRSTATTRSSPRAPAWCGTTSSRRWSPAGSRGVECLSGIPGLVGATPMQNVGAYGQEVADTIVRVRALDRDDRRGRRRSSPRRAGSRTARARSRARRGGSIIEVQFRLPRRATSAPIRYAELAQGARHRRGRHAHRSHACARP